MFGRFLNVPLKSFFDVPLLSLSVSSPIFLTWIPVKHPREIFFCRNGQRISVASYFQDKAPSQILGSFMNAFLNSIVMLLYYQNYYSFSFIPFVILLFPCFIILALIALRVNFCVLSFIIFSDVGLLCYLFWTVFIFYQFFILPLDKTSPCSKSVYTHTLQYVLC